MSTVEAAVGAFLFLCLVVSVAWLVRVFLDERRRK